MHILGYCTLFHIQALRSVELLFKLTQLYTKTSFFFLSLFHVHFELLADTKECICICMPTPLTPIPLGLEVAQYGGVLEELKSISFLLI